MPKQAEPIRARLRPGTTYIFQDYIGSRLTFSDGEVLELFGPIDGYSLFFSWYPQQRQPYTHAEACAMYERVRQVVKVEDILGEPYEYAPGSSRVIRK
jgi:hypothetical protein